MGMPNGDATAIVYTVEPTCTAILGMFVLRERLRYSTALSIALSIAGLLLIVQPSFLFPKGHENDDRVDTYFLGVACVFASGICASLQNVLIRLGRECHWTAVENAAALSSAFIFTPLVLGGIVLVRGSINVGTPPEWLGTNGAFVFAISSGIIAFVGLALQTTGYQLVDAAMGSAMGFAEVPFAYLLQTIVFREPPSVLSLVGVAVMTSSVLINFLGGWHRDSS